MKRLTPTQLLRLLRRRKTGDDVFVTRLGCRRLETAAMQLRLPTSRRKLPPLISWIPYDGCATVIDLSDRRINLMALEDKTSLALRGLVPMENDIVYVLAWPMGKVSTYYLKP